MHRFNGAGKQITRIFLTPLGKSELNVKAALPHRHAHSSLLQKFLLAALLMHITERREIVFYQHVADQ